MSRSCLYLKFYGNRYKGFALTVSLYLQLERAIEDGFIAADRVDDVVIVDKDPVQLVRKVVQRMSQNEKK